MFEIHLSFSLRFYEFLIECTHLCNPAFPIKKETALRQSPNLQFIQILLIFYSFPRKITLRYLFSTFNNRLPRIHTEIISPIPTVTTLKGIDQSIPL